MIAGKYGNGADRRKTIAKLGLDFDVVQKRVEEILAVYYTVKRGDTLSGIAKSTGQLPPLSRS